MPWSVVGHGVDTYKCEVHALALELRCRPKLLCARRLRRVGGVRLTGHSTFPSFVECVVGHENRVTVASAFFVLFYVRPALMLFMTDVNKSRGSSLQARFYSCH